MASKAPQRSAYDEPPAFCCCEFVDRHGRGSHLSDAAFLDEHFRCASGSSASCVWELCLDLDDRCRLPMYNGAIYLGIEGALPIFVLPLLCSAASRSLGGAAVLLVLAPVLLAAHHRRAWRQRRRCVCSHATCPSHSAHVDTRVRRTCARVRALADRSSLSRRRASPPRWLTPPSRFGWPSTSGLAGGFWSP